MDDQIILLDLRRSRYVGVVSEPSLAGAIEGWPGDPVAVPPARAPDPDRLAATLISQGFLTYQPRPAGSQRPLLVAPDRSLNADDADPTPAFRWRQASHLFRSGAAASWRLRWHSLAAIADAIATRRAKLSTDAADILEATRDAVAAYVRLRTFAFTTHDRCLHDALTLTGFLAAEGIASQWVIGVRTRPFAAHSWIQIGNVVLNDHHENVRRFVPILVA